MDKLKKTQRKVFDYIRETIDEKGVAPSVREICAAVGVKSTSTVQYHINQLVEGGYLERGDLNKKRSLTISGRNTRANYVPLVGTVTAGQPILAVESIEDYIPVPVNAAGRELFALHVRGDSMINASICDGDLVIVEKTPVAENGEIVVALIDDEATVKRFYKEDGHFRLQPENEHYEPIIVDELAVLGKVVALIRNYE
ncbi:MAG: transcriptional repressor LexA [Ruminococcaceae bacterium]|nr:transcriptional repressor LexA [Oscillospiraceae bacterium]